MDRLFCAKPFRHFEIQEDGRAYLCCPGWLPKSVGSVGHSAVADLFNNDEAQRIRLSILDGSFRYCTGCPFLRAKSGPVSRVEDVVHPEHLAILRERRLVVDRIRWLNLAYDRSCNLSCPSCRKEVHATSGGMLRRLKAFQRIILTKELLRSIDWLYVTGSGDPFASSLFRDLLRSLSAADYPHLRIALHTNGLLFTPEAWQSLRPAHGLVHSVEVSIDAASPETYALNRRGGEWSRLVQSLDFIAGLRRAGAFRRLKLSFVVQANNWREMPAFVQLAQGHGADWIQFTPLRNWGTFEAQEYLERAVHLPGHTEHRSFRELFEGSPELRSEEVELADFSSYNRCHSDQGPSPAVG